MSRQFNLKFPKCSVKRNCPRRALYKGGCKDHCLDVVDGDKEIRHLSEELKGVEGQLDDVSAQRRKIEFALRNVDDALCRRVPSSDSLVKILTMVFKKEEPHHYAIAHCEKPVYEACTGLKFDADQQRDWRTLKEYNIDNIIGRAKDELQDLRGRIYACLRTFDHRVASVDARVAAAREKLLVAEDTQRKRKERWEHVDLNYLTAATKHAYNVIMRNVFRPGGWYSGKYLKRRNAAMQAKIDEIKGKK